MFALTVKKLVFRNSGNFRAKTNPRKPLNSNSGNDWGPIPVLAGTVSG